MKLLPSDPPCEHCGSNRPHLCPKDTPLQAGNRLLMSMFGLQEVWIGRPRREVPYPCIVVKEAT